jgi:hypothetical protein
LLGRKRFGRDWLAVELSGYDVLIAHCLSSGGGSFARIGGHGTEPYEQNTQQSPGLGLNLVRQPVHSKKMRHASIGIISIFARPQQGQVIRDSRIMVFLNYGGAV